MTDNSTTRFAGAGGARRQAATAPLFSLFAAGCAVAILAGPAVTRALAAPAAAAPGASAAAAPATGSGARRAAAPIRLSVDATETPRHLLHARLTMPVQPGPLALAYPKWMPGEHGPTGPVVDVVGLRFQAGGRTIPWKRDPADMFVYHLEVPDGASILEAELDFVSPADVPGFSSGSSATENLLVLSWNQVLLYPAGPNADDIAFEAELTLPKDWRYGTALRTSAPAGSAATKGSDAETPGDTPPQGGFVRFKPVSLTTLVDSPVLAGRHLKTVRLSPPGDARPAWLHVGADSDAALDVPPEVWDHFRRLVAEATRLFGARHYGEYHFLLTLSDHVAHFGLEHHESSDDRIDERGLVDPDRRLLHADLLAHEMVHSWNGKYRRPGGLIRNDYRQPIDSSLVWVYEGLTNYLGDILSARAGLRTPDEFHDQIAWISATLDHRPGRAWRPLVDTATAAQILYDSSHAWQSQRRGVDFYDEGTLIWLEADTLIRQKSGGRKSLDDFCRMFHGGADGPPAVKPYEADDVYAALNQVLPNDWKGFFETRVYEVRPRAPLGGIEAGGWRLGWTDKTPPLLKSRQEVDELTDARFSLGIQIKKDDSIEDVLGDTPADRAGLAPGMKVIAVDGRRFSRHVLEDRLRLGKGSPDPIEILAENGEFFRTIKIPYRDGLRYPALERDSTKPDLLGAIITPLVPAPQR